MGVEPTCDTKYRTTGLKPAPGAGQKWLPEKIVAGRGQAASTLLAGALEVKLMDAIRFLLKFPGRLTVGQRPLEP